MPTLQKPAKHPDRKSNKKTTEGVTKQIVAKVENYKVTG